MSHSVELSLQKGFTTSEPGVRNEQEIHIFFNEKKSAIFVTSEESGQPYHLPSLIRVFSVHLMGS